MAPFFANRSCDPYLPRSAQCVIGAYTPYVVDVSTPQQISQTIAFATAHNIRLVIRSTGHDYNGKSSGPGALSIWTHHLKNIAIHDYSDPYYSGKAITMGAGVQAFEAYDVADAQGLRVVGGECATVGLAGGYTQGGGHSLLASAHGLAADQTLSWTVVLSTGEHVTASRVENPDLYWALSGGGGGTYGVVTSLTAKAHPDGPVSGGNLTFSASGVNQDDFWNAVEIFHASVPAFTDAGAAAVWIVTKEGFSLSPFAGPDIPAQSIDQYLQPLTDFLDAHDIKYELTTRDFSRYLDMYNTMMWPVDVGTSQYGGRLLPRAVVQQNNSALTSAIRAITTKHNTTFTGIGVNVGQAHSDSANAPGNNSVYNSVNSAWRRTSIDAVVSTPWDFTAPWSEMLDRQREMTDVIVPALSALTPDGGCYLNEGDFRQPDWQSVFYGGNYDRLRDVKEQYDPAGVWWATTAVGSEKWEQRANGRLCETGS
ncbi:MAG: hypothetical protein Q9162_007104 [Coniocarpon cinnabarinum]